MMKSSAHWPSMKRSMLAWTPLLTGCGPKPEEICGTGLSGAMLYAVVAWALLLVVRRVTDRIKTGAWPALDSTAGVVPMAAAFLAVSVGALVAAPQVPNDTVGIVMACAAANLLTWALLVQLVTGWTAAGAVLLAGLLSLGPAVGGAMGSDLPAMVTIYQWFYGGFMGIVPAGVVLIIWFVAWLRRRPADA